MTNPSVRIHGGVDLRGQDTEIHNLELEQLLADPIDESPAALWFNKTLMRISYNEVENNVPVVRRMVHDADLESAKTILNNNIASAVSTLNSSITAESNSLQSSIASLVPKTTTVNGQPLSSNVVVTAIDLNLGNVNNTSDLNKPVSTATQSALDTKANQTTTYTKIETDNRIQTALPTTLPASDVFPWAKASVKPTYSAAEIGAPSGNGTSTGTNTGDQIISIAGEVVASNSTGVLTATISNSAVINKTLSGYVKTAGTISATDTILTAIQKLDAVAHSNSFDGSVNINAVEGTGLLVDNGYGWHDLIGSIQNMKSATGLTLSNFRGSLSANANAVGAGYTLAFHLPHDYAPGTDVFIHTHWSHNATSCSGSFGITYSASYCKGHNQAGETFGAPISLSQTASGLTIANTPRYGHFINEVQLSAINPTANQLDTALLEVDGLIMVEYLVTAIPSLSGGSPNRPFVFQIDIHYQSTGITTKNKAPDFYI